MGQIKQRFTDLIPRNRANILALFLFIALTAIAAWPVISNLNTLLIGYGNDVYINPWAEWWTAKALANPDLSLWQTPFLFYPQGTQLFYHSFSHLNTIISLAFHPFLGPIRAYNLVMLINIVLNGFSMFQLARYQTRSTTAAILAGIIFAFNTQITHQSSHPDLFSVWCLPWLTLYFMRAVRENSVRLALIAAVFFFLGSAASTLLLVIMSIWLLILFLFMMFSAEHPRPHPKIILIFGTTSFILVLPLIYPILKEAITNQNDTFLINPANSASLEIFSILIPPWYIGLKQSFYLGIIPLFLSLAATRSLKKDGKLWFLLIIISFLFAIGPIPRLFGRNLNIILPWSLALTPFLRNMYRMMLLFSFGWAMISALGWLQIQKAARLSPRAMRLTAVLIAVLIYADYTLAPYPTTPVVVSAFYTQYLQQIPDDIALAILPIGSQPDKRYMFYQTFHNHPLTGGHVSRPDPDSLQFIASNPLLRAGSLDLDPSAIPPDIEEQFDQLAAVNIGYIILDKNMMAEYDQEISIWRSAIPCAPIYEDDLLLVYETK